MKSINKYIILFIFLSFFSYSNAQNELDSIQNLLNGKWIWSKCDPAPFDCFEQPTEEHSRSIQFSNIRNSDSLLYETYRNDTLIDNGKTKIIDISLPSCIITNDVIFGGDSIFGNVYKRHRLIIENDTLLKFMLGDKKSTLVYKYKKKGVVNNLSNIYFNRHSYIDQIFYTYKYIGIKVNIPNDLHNDMLRILTIQGNTIYEQKIYRKGAIVYKIPNSFPAGIYICCLYSSSHLIDSKKIVIGLK